MNTAEFALPIPKALNISDREYHLRAVFSDAGLRELKITAGAPRTQSGLDTMKDPAFIREKFSELKAKLQARAKGDNANIAWREFDLSGRADFHVRVWKAMYGIPFGEVATYAEVADLAGSPVAFRACGQACGANPIILFIPCHRVVSSTGLGGFGCGLDWKKKFLALEGVDVSQFKSARKTSDTPLLLPR